MELHSDSFANGARIPARHTCEGADLSPMLEWSGAPVGTLSFVVIADDPDAPGRTWAHWGVYDIPARTTRLEEGQRGGYGEAVTDFGKTGYGGPCPPPGHGVHHYHFRVLALDVARLDVPRTVDCRALERAARPHVLDRAEWVGTYSR